MRFGDWRGQPCAERLAWQLVQRARQSPGRTLRSLLAPFLGPFNDVFPPSLQDHTVHVTRGVHCGVALGSESPHCAFLELLAVPDGTTALLHHTSERETAPDIAFLVHRPASSVGDPPRQRLVIISVAGQSATAGQLLDSTNMGRWHNDQRLMDAGAGGIQYGESSKHAALRATLAAHPDWCDPVRVLVAPRPWSKSSRKTAARVNHTFVPQQPVLLARFPSGSSTGEPMASPSWPGMWWPTRVRHWPADSPHPQTLPPRPPSL